MGYLQAGWRWHRIGGAWHRAPARGSCACGLVPPGRSGRASPPTGAEVVCETCARLTRYRRRGARRATQWVRVSLPRREVREVLRAGLDPAGLLRDAWRELVPQHRPLRPASPPLGSLAADALADDRRRVIEAAGPLLEAHGGRGVPGADLKAALGFGWPYARLRRVLGSMRTIRFGDRVAKGYPASRFRPPGAE